MQKKETFSHAILKILVQQKKISQPEAKVIAKAFSNSTKEYFSDFVLEEGLLESDDLLEAFSMYYQVPAFDVPAHFFETHLLRMFPKDFLLRNEIIPLERDENMLIVVASEPDNSDLLAKIGEHVSYDIRFRVGIARDICDAVKEFYDKALTENNYDEDIPQEEREKRQVQRMEQRGQELLRDQDYEEDYPDFEEIDQDNQDE